MISKQAQNRIDDMESGPLWCTSVAPNPWVGIPQGLNKY